MCESSDEPVPEQGGLNPEADDLTGDRKDKTLSAMVHKPKQ